MNDIGPSNRFEHMTFDIGQSYFIENFQPNENESLNKECQRFYDMLEVAP